MAVSDGNRSYVGNGAGNGDIQANGNDADGTILNAGAGNDILRGGAYNDILSGGSGDDQMFGGDGADQFRFFGDQQTGLDTDRVYDLDFSEGDTLVFGNWGAGTFNEDTGVDALNPSNNGAIISSWEGVVNAVNFSGNVTANREAPGNDNLVLTITDADGDVNNIVITGGYSQYIAAGGTDGA